MPNKSRQRINDSMPLQGNPDRRRKEGDHEDKKHGYVLYWPATGGGSWSNSSDARLKDITGEYSKGLDAIKKLSPVTFYYKEDNPRGLSSDQEYVGFVAQEVQEVLPEAVSKGLDGY